MAEENLSWGYTRIRDALYNLGITTDRNTVKRILNDNGIEPAPERKRKMRWSTFIAAHLDVLAAMDFFNVEVLTFAGIVRYHVFFAIHLKTREVQIVGIKANPSEEWMKQMARNLTDCYDGFLKDMRYVIMDNDPLFTTCFRGMLRDTGTKPVGLPRRSPNLNPNAGRFVLSIKGECLDKIIPLGERHLRKAIKEFMAHYHAERNHQGLDSEIISPDEHVGVEEGQIKTRKRLGGLLNYYYREAA